MYCKGVIDLQTSVFNEFGFIPYQLTATPLRRMFQRMDENPLRYRYLGEKYGFFNYGRFASMQIIDSFFSETTFYINFCLKEKLLTNDEIIAVFPTRKLEFKEKINQIIEEIDLTGTFKSFDERQVKYRVTTQ